MPGESYLRDLWLCLCDVFQGRINWRQTDRDRHADIDTETKRDRQTDRPTATDRQTDRESSSRGKCRYERNKPSCICIHDLVQRTRS